MQQVSDCLLCLCSVFVSQSHELADQVPQTTDDDIQRFGRFLPLLHPCKRSKSFVVEPNLIICQSVKSVL